MNKNIVVKGAREHNLKNIDIEIPRDKLVVFTGLSGSGKSSLAFDTIYAEGQRRYVESLSSYARMFLGQMDKPDVDYIEGLSPAISIDQKRQAKIRVQQSAPLRKFMTICVCFGQESVFRIVPFAAGKFRRKRLTKSLTRLCSSRKGQKFKFWLRLQKVKKASLSRNFRTFKTRLCPREN